METNNNKKILKRQATKHSHENTTEASQAKQKHSTT